MYVWDVCTRCTSCMYEIYEMYVRNVFTRYTRCTWDMRKYEIDGRYSSQYGFHNGVKSHLVRSVGEPALAVRPHWKLNSSLFWPVSLLILSTYNDLTYDRANSSLSKLQFSWHARTSVIYLYTIAARCLLNALCRRLPIHVKNIFRSNIYLKSSICQGI